MSGKNKLDGRILYGLKKPQEIKTGIMMEKCRKIISQKHSARSFRVFSRTVGDKGSQKKSV